MWVGRKVKGSWWLGGDSKLQEITQKAQRDAIRNVNLPRDKTDPCKAEKGPADALFVPLVGFSSCSLI